MNLQDSINKFKETQQKLIEESIKKIQNVSKNDLDISVHSLSKDEIKKNLEEERKLNSSLLKSQTTLDEAIIAKSKFEKLSTFNPKEHKRSLKQAKRETAFSVKTVDANNLKALDEDDSYKKLNIKHNEKKSIRASIASAYQTLKAVNSHKAIYGELYKKTIAEGKAAKKQNLINKKFHKIEKKANKLINKIEDNAAKINPKNVDKINKTNANLLKRANKVQDKKEDAAKKIEEKVDLGRLKYTTKKVLSPANSISNAIYTEAKKRTETLSTRIEHARLATKDYLSKIDAAKNKDNPLVSSIREANANYDKMIEDKKNQELQKSQQVDQEKTADNVKKVEIQPLTLK